MPEKIQKTKISSGIKGLDYILNGGYFEYNSYLIAGGPGSGKTTVCLHFLEEGDKKGEPCLFYNLMRKGGTNKKQCFFTWIKPKKFRIS